MKERVEYAIGLGELPEVIRKANYTAAVFTELTSIIKELYAENQAQKQMLQNSLNIITQSSSERECELELENEALKTAFKEISISEECHEEWYKAIANEALYKTNTKARAITIQAYKKKYPESTIEDICRDIGIPKYVVEAALQSKEE